MPTRISAGVGDHPANCHLHSRNGAQKRTKENFGRTVMQLLELLRLEKKIRLRTK